MTGRRGGWARFARTTCLAVAGFAAYAGLFALGLVGTSMTLFIAFAGTIGTAGLVADRRGPHPHCNVPAALTIDGTMDSRLRDRWARTRAACVGLVDLVAVIIAYGAVIAWGLVGGTGQLLLALAGVIAAAGVTYANVRGRAYLASAALIVCVVIDVGWLLVTGVLATAL